MIHKINKVTCIVTPHVNTAALTVCVCVCVCVCVTEESNTERACDTLLMCIVTVLNHGLRNGGGVGDVLRKPSKNVRTRKRPLNPSHNTRQSQFMVTENFKTSSSILSFTLYFLTAGNKKLHQSPGLISTDGVNNSPHHFFCRLNFSNLN